VSPIGSPFPLPVPVDPAALQPRVLLWPVLWGLGAYLLLTAQPLGRPKPDLAERLRLLDVDERVRMELDRREERAFYVSLRLERLLRPVVDDAGRLLRALLARLGLGGGADLERKLAAARPGVDPVQFFGEKAVCALVGLGLCPLLAALGAEPFGPWPVWLWVALAGAGFAAPDAELERRLAARRARAVMELPVLLDMLAIGVSAGLALEQALERVARQAHGAVARELRQAVRETALGGLSVIEALEAMAERNAVPELTRVVGQLRAGHDQGLPLMQTLAAQAAALRERKRLRIVEEGGKASVRMVLPVAVFILPVLFVVLLWPAAEELTRLGG
jgi:tight adherence protein C